MNGSNHEFRYDLDLTKMLQESTIFQRKTQKDLENSEKQLVVISVVDILVDN